MTVNDSDVFEMKRRSLFNTEDISPEIAIGEYRLRRRGRVSGTRPWCFIVSTYFILFINGH